jgi:transposase-like protein
LVEQARSEGLSLTGADGLLTAVTRRVIQAASEAEMTEHLGYAKGDRATAAETEGGNHRNGGRMGRLLPDDRQDLARGSNSPRFCSSRLRSGASSTPPT